MNRRPRALDARRVGRSLGCLLLLLTLVACEDSEPAPSSGAPAATVAEASAPLATAEPEAPAREAETRLDTEVGTAEGTEAEVDSPTWVAEPQPELRTARSVTLFLEEGEPRSTAAAIAAELEGTLDDRLADSGTYLIRLSNVTRDEARAAGERAQQHPGVRMASGGGSLGRLDW